MLALCFECVTKCMQQRVIIVIYGLHKLVGCFFVAGVGDEVAVFHHLKPFVSILNQRNITGFLYGRPWRLNGGKPLGLQVIFKHLPR